METKINFKEFAVDLLQGMPDPDLMEKHGVTQAQLDRLREQATLKT